MNIRNQNHMSLNDAVPQPARPKSESDIVSDWLGGIDQPLVTILCITYNHAPYIEDALNGFLIQETTFAFEILIHDDASTDGTREIIESYQERYPKIIRTVLQRENQYKQGRKGREFLRPLYRGKYIAICEGDDCWLSRDKLSLQVNALKKYPTIDLCIHPAIEFNYVISRKRFIGVYRKNDGTVPVEDIIHKTYGQIATAATLIRREAFDEFERFECRASYPRVGDLFLHFFGAKKAGAYYIDKALTLYRAQLPGSWTLRNSVDAYAAISNTVSILSTYELLDKETFGKFTKEISEENRKHVLALFKHPYISCVDKIKFLRNYYKTLRLLDVFIYFPLIFIPRFTWFVRLVSQNKAFRMLNRQ